MSGKKPGYTSPDLLVKLSRSRVLKDFVNIVPGLGFRHFLGRWLGRGCSRSRLPVLAGCGLVFSLQGQESVDFSLDIVCRSLGGFERSNLVALGGDFGAQIIAVAAGRSLTNITFVHLI